MKNDYLVPISVKGIVLDAGKIWLRRNERKEWELPGGKIDKGEQPEETIIRELKEELGFETEVIRLVQCHLYTVETSVNELNGVLVITYLCRILIKIGTFEFSGEAGPAIFKSFSVEEIQLLNMPEFYKKAVYGSTIHYLGHEVKQ